MKKMNVQIYNSVNELRQMGTEEVGPGVITTQLIKTPYWAVGH